MAKTSARHTRRRRLPLAAASIVAALSLVAGVLAAVHVFGGWGRAPAASAGSPVAVHPVQGHRVPVPAMRPWTRPHTSWPAALNEAGANVLDEILTNPGTVQGTMQGGNFAGGKIYIAPNGIGAVFSPSGVFEYFGKFPYP